MTHINEEGVIRASALLKKFIRDNGNTGSDTTVRRFVYSFYAAMTGIGRVAEEYQQTIRDIEAENALTSTFNEPTIELQIKALSCFLTDTERYMLFSEMLGDGEDEDELTDDEDDDDVGTGNASEPDPAASGGEPTPPADEKSEPEGVKPEPTQGDVENENDMAKDVATPIKVTEAGARADLEATSAEELKHIATHFEIAGRSSMNKEDLIGALIPLYIENDGDIFPDEDGNFG